MKYLKSFENQLLNSILDKISQSGVDSLSSLEKEYLNKFSKDQSTEEVQKKINTKIYTDKIGPYDATLILNDVEEPYDGHSRWSGKLTVNDIQYDQGQILFQDDNYLSGYFYNDNGDVFTDLEGLEYEIDAFCENAFYNAKNVNECLLLEGRIEDIEIKFQKRINPKIVEYFKENDPTNNKAYFEWLCDRYSKLDTKKENIEKAMIKMVTKYENIKHKLAQKQINRIKSVEELGDLLNQDKDWHTLKNKDGVDVIYDSYEWIIFVPYTEEISEQFGDKSWCTVYNPSEHFAKHFGKDGALIYCINKLDISKNFAIEQTVQENGERKCDVWDNKDEKPVENVFLTETIKYLVKVNYLPKNTELKKEWNKIIEDIPQPNMTEVMFRISMTDLLEEKGVIWASKEFGTYIIFETIDVSDNYIYIENFINDKLKQKIIKNPAYNIDDTSILYDIIINDFPYECENILDSVPWEDREDKNDIEVLEEIGIIKVFEYFPKDSILNELIDSYIRLNWNGTPHLEEKIEEIWSIDVNDSLDIPELANVINNNISWIELAKSIYHELDMEHIRDALEI